MLKDLLRIPGEQAEGVVMLLRLVPEEKREGVVHQMVKKLRSEGAIAFLAEVNRLARETRKTATQEDEGERMRVLSELRRKAGILCHHAIAEGNMSPHPPAHLKLHA